ncbi:hypothetical protein EBZ80_24325 [bacterium]|nr:hypothetical protein [bacterium]
MGANFQCTGLPTIENNASTGIGCTGSTDPNCFVHPSSYSVDTVTDDYTSSTTSFSKQFMACTAYYCRVRMMYQTKFSDWAYFGTPIQVPPQNPGSCSGTQACDASLDSTVYQNCYDVNYGGGLMLTSTWQATYGGGGSTGTSGGSSTGGTSPSPPPVLPACSCTLNPATDPSCDNYGYTTATSMYQGFCGNIGSGN